MAYAITRILDLNFLNVTNHVMEWEEEVKAFVGRERERNRRSLDETQRRRT